MKRLILMLLSLLLGQSLMAQLDTDYFQKAHTEVIPTTDEIEWKTIGPGMSGYCEEFWCHPTEEGVMFMSPDMGNSYGTWDDGETWLTIKGRSNHGQMLNRLKAMAFSYQDPNLGMTVDARGQFYHTTDMGRNWTLSGSLPDGRYTALAVDPTDDDIWYAGGGNFWDVKFNHRTKAALDDPNKGYFYPYSAYGNLMKSTDGGKTWTKKSSGLPAKMDVGRIIIDPTNNNNLLLATNYGVYRSTNQGDSWSLSGAGLPTNMPRDMQCYYDENTKEFIIYVLEQTVFEASGTTVTTTGGIYKSTDGGQNWLSITGDLGFDLNQVTAFHARDGFYKSLSQWFGITKDAAKSQFTSFPASTMSVWNRIAVNPKNKNEIYVSHNLKHDRGSFGVGDVWKTSDGGLTWKAVARTGKYWIENPDASYWSSRSNPIGMNTQYAHLHEEQTDRYEIYGNRFLSVNLKGEVFACLEQQIVRSNDAGATWNQVDDDETVQGSGHWIGRGGSNLPGRYILMNTGMPDRYLFCSGEHGLWQTAPLADWPNKKDIALEQIEGQTKSHDAATSIATVAVHPDNPDIIYTLQFRQDHRGYFRRSIDGGKTWENYSRPLVHNGNDSQDMLFTYSLMIDPEDPNIIYFTSIEHATADVSTNLAPTDFDGYGIYKSINGGKTWSVMNTGLPADASVRRLAMHPKQPKTLYAALNVTSSGTNGGLYLSTDGAGSWQKVNIPTVIKSVNNIFIDPTNQWMYISCGQFEGSLNEGGVWRSKDDGASWNKIFDMPYVWQTETSRLNPDIITVACASQNDKKAHLMPLNGGAYLSKDGGATWMKVNHNIGQVDRITDFKPDAFVEGVYWLAQFGSGWSIGYDQSQDKGWYELIAPIAKEKGSTHLDPVLDAGDLKGHTLLYPNPTTDVIHLDGQIGAIKIYDLNGVEASGWKVLSPNTVSVSSLSAGVYFLQVINANQGSFVKFCKK